MFLSTLFAAAALLTLLSFPAYSRAGAFDPTSPYPYLTTASFTSIKNTPAERLVLFFHSSPTAHATLATLNTVARRLRTELPHFTFQYCNGSQPVNSADFQAAGFNSGEWLFTSTPVEGIMKYTGPVSVSELVDHVRHKYLTSEVADLVRFSTEDEFYTVLDTPPALPVFVKFFEPWCEHCKRLAPTFAISATYFRSAVRHMEVQCSGGTEETQFCQRHGVTSYPVVMLFNGEQTVRYEGEERSVRAFDAFFEQNVVGYESRVKAVRREKVANKKRLRPTEAEVEVEEATAAVVESAVRQVEEAVVKSTKKGKSDEQTQKSTTWAAQKELPVVTPGELAVADRLSALEKEVGEMHNTLRAIQQQMTALAAQRR